MELYHQKKEIAMHIVIFTGGESPEPEFTEKFFSWAESPSLTVAADSGLDTL